MRTVFFGTPALAVPYLELLADETELKGVITMPDEPAGRGYERQASAVKQAADQRKLPVVQPENLTDPGFLSTLQAFSPELAVVVAYGKILPVPVLKVPKHGFINVHFSLLPAYRGAAPIQRALMQGDTQTGVSLFWLDEGMDTGPVFLQKTLPIADEDDADSLRGKLVPLGLGVLKEALQRTSQGELLRMPQSGPVSLAPSLKREEGQIDWRQPARAILNLIRGTTPWPGAFTFVGAGDKHRRLKILKAGVLEELAYGSETPRDPGSVVLLERERAFVVRCAREFLQVRQVQPEGKRPMSAWDFWQGARMKNGDKLG